MFPDLGSFIASWGIFGVFLFTFLLALIPFFSPSNAWIALIAALTLPGVDKFAIGLAVALAATAAKTVHFVASYGAGKFIDKRKGRKIIGVGKYGRVSMYALNVIAAATPLPDEWIVVPLGLSEANVVWFVATYLGGKLIITIPSAYLGNAIAPFILQFFGDSGTLVSVVIGVVSTVVIIAIFVLVDVEAATLRILRKLGIIRDEQLGESKDKS